MLVLRVSINSILSWKATFITPFDPANLLSFDVNSSMVIKLMQGPNMTNAIVIFTFEYKRISFLFYRYCIRPIVLHNILDAFYHRMCQLWNASSVNRKMMCAQKCKLRKTIPFNNKNVSINGERERETPYLDIHSIPSAKDSRQIFPEFGQAHTPRPVLMCKVILPWRVYVPPVRP